MNAGVISELSLGVFQSLETRQSTTIDRLLLSSAAPAAPAVPSATENKQHNEDDD
jgi:hypothetical protein